MDGGRWTVGYMSVARWYQLRKEARSEERGARAPRGRDKERRDGTGDGKTSERGGKG